MEYTGDLPSFKLNPGTLKEFETLLSKSFPTKTRSQKITITYSGFSKSYTTVNELLDDPTKPNSVKEINWIIKTGDWPREQSIQILGYENLKTSVSINCS